jgi:excinuclease UvrABC nuclease subunit
MDKLRLTRDVPRCPGTYRFVDTHGTILYVGKADRLRERVRSYFVPGGGHTRKVRQAIHQVERIDWDQTFTPLEAVVREQELILEHKPPCNVMGCRPENYMYLKAGGPGLGLSLSMTGRQPRWMTAEGNGARPSRTPLVIGPFRGRSRLAQALDLLHRCYPIRRCPRGTTSNPCVRHQCGDCLAPCTGDPDALREHDALVAGILGWLAGERPEGFSDPLDRAGDLVLSLSRQRRFEEAQRVREAADDLAGIRRSYQSLMEAVSLRFAALFPAVDEDGTAVLRLNLVWDGRLHEAASLPSASAAEEIEARLYALWAGGSNGTSSRHLGASPVKPPVVPSPPIGMDGAPPVAVTQGELDSVLAIRRWYKESEAAPLVVLPGPDSGLEERESARERLVTEAWNVLAVWPADRVLGSVL